jgi:hypothetical protein
MQYSDEALLEKYAGRIVAGAVQTTRSMRFGHAISVGDMLMLRYERAASRNASGGQRPS